MDPLGLAFGTALVGAITTSTWQQVREAVIRVWCYARPHDGDQIGAELGELRKHVLQAVMMTGSSHDSSTFNQIGVQTNYHRR